MMPSQFRVPIYREGVTKKGFPFYVVDVALLPEPEITGCYHIRYRCPWCSQARTDKKLYYNTLVGCGFCFRCEIVIISHEKKIVSTDIEHYIWFNHLSEQGRLLDISWTRTALVSDQAKRYILNRQGRYDLDVISRYNIRFFEGVHGGTFLLLPDSGPERLKVRAFQTTRIDRRTVSFGPKYLTYPNEKYIFFLDLRGSDERLILVEGIFDAIATGGCALLGKHLSKNQQRQLFHYLNFPETRNREIFVVLDGEVSSKEKITLCRQILSLNSTRPVYYTDLPVTRDSRTKKLVGIDPEEAIGGGIFWDHLEMQSRRVLR